jgi:hypothetical protein
VCFDDPCRHHAPQRHHIPRARHRATNWSACDRGLVQRGDVRFWIDETALEKRLPPHRTEGFVRSLLG